MAEDLATQKSKKRPQRQRSISPDHETLNGKRQKVKRKNLITTTTAIATTTQTSSVNLCQRLSSALESVLVESKNESFRTSCFEILSVQNGADAGTKIQELATKLKGKRQQQGEEKKSQKNQ